MFIHYTSLPVHIKTRLFQYIPSHQVLRLF